MKNLRIIISLLIIIVGVQTVSFTQLLRNSMSTSAHNAEVELYRERIQRFLVKSDNLFRQGNHLEALNQLDLAVEAAPQNPEAYLHRAMLRYRLGMATEAKQDIAIVARMNPIASDLFGLNGPKAQLELLAFYPEDMYLELDRVDRISVYNTKLVAWEEAITADHVTDDLPELEAAATHLTIILEAITEQNWEVAEKELQLLALIKANESTVYDLKGVVALGRDNLVQAAAYFRKAIQLDSNNAMAWYNLSITQHKNQFSKAALESINKAIQLQPTLSIAYFDRAILHKELGDLDAAIADYSSLLLSDDIYHLPTMFNRALTFKKLGQFTAAMNDLDYLIQLAPEVAMPYKVRGNIHLLLGYYHRAVSDFTKAIEKDEDLAEAYFNRAIAHLLNNDVLPACMDFEESATKGYERGQEKQVYFCSN